MRWKTECQSLIPGLHAIVDLEVGLDEVKLRTKGWYFNTDGTFWLGT